MSLISGAVTVVSPGVTLRDGKLICQVLLENSDGRSLGEIGLEITAGQAKKAAEDLIRAIYERGADLNRTIANAINQVQKASSVLVDQLRDSFSKRSINNIEGLLGAVMEFSKYLQSAYASVNAVREPISEGSLHIVRYAPPRDSKEDVYTVTFSSYLSPGGALSPKLIYGKESLSRFLTEDIGISKDDVDGYISSLERQAAISVPRVSLNQRDVQRFGFF